MRVSDIFVISPKGPSEELPSDLLESSAVQEIITRCEYLAHKTIESLVREELSQVQGLLPYVDLKSDTYFSFKQSLKEDVFLELYVSLVKNLSALSFEKFCSSEVRDLLRVSSSHTPIIIYWDDESGLFMGVLEDFLRMPGSKDGEYRLHAVFSRHY